MWSLTWGNPPSILPHHEPRRTAQSKTLNARALGHPEIARRPSMLKVKRSKKNRVEAFDIDDPDLDEKLNDAIQRAWERVEEESRRLAEELEDWNPDPDLRGHRNRTSGGRMLRTPRPARLFFLRPAGQSEKSDPPDLRRPPNQVDIRVPVVDKAVRYTRARTHRRTHTREAEGSRASARVCALHTHVARFYMRA